MGEVCSVADHGRSAGEATRPCYWMRSQTTVSTGSPVRMAKPGSVPASAGAMPRSRVRPQWRCRASSNATPQPLTGHPRSTSSLGSLRWDRVVRPTSLRESPRCSVTTTRGSQPSVLRSHSRPASRWPFAARATADRALQSLGPAAVVVETETTGRNPLTERAFSVDGALHLAIHVLTV